MVAKHLHHGRDAMGAVALASLQFRHDEIIEFLTFGQSRPRQGQDIPAHPIGQHLHIRRQRQGLVFFPPNQIELASQGLSLTGPLDLLVLVFDLLAS